MPVFGIGSKPDKKLRDYMSQIHENLQVRDFFRNPFIGNIKLFRMPGQDLYAIHIIPTYPRFYLIGIFFEIMRYLITRDIYSWVSIIDYTIISIGVFWTRYAYYVFILLGARRKKIKTRIRLVTLADLTKRIILSK